jgi:hypothetical protein
MAIIIPRAKISWTIDQSIEPPSVVTVPGAAGACPAGVFPFLIASSTLSPTANTREGDDNIRLPTATDHIKILPYTFVIITPPFLDVDV